MNILSIESTTDVCGVCVVTPHETLYYQEITQPKIHSEKLPQFVHNAIHQSKKPISAIAVSIGPGSYTGLRIGVSLAKGLAFAMGLPIITVPTLVSMNDSLESEDNPRYVFVHSYGEWIFVQKFLNALAESEPQCIRIKDFQPDSVVNRIYGYGDFFSGQKQFEVQQVCPSSKWVGNSAIKNFDLWVENDINKVTPLYITNFKLQS